LKNKFFKARKKPRQDSRINAGYPVWLEYVGMWFVMLCLTGGQSMIFYSFMGENNPDIPLAFIFANIGYWGLMSLAFCAVTFWIRRNKFERPLKKMGEAARQVTEGDFSVHIDPVRKDGKKDYIEVMFEDFNKMVDELSSIEMLTNDFVSNVSHEIKTPLSVIQSYALALQKETVTGEQRKEYTDTIITASEKLNTLVTNILKLSKLENQKIVPAWEEYNLCGQLTECALTFEDLWESKNITFTADMDDKAVIRADKNMLEVVWNNLLSNAFKFTPSGGSVTLTQTSDEDTVTVMVSDTGCGIDETALHRIFDKFYQGDTSHSQEGNGLGLALTLRVVELMGGQISAKSSPGEGSTFTVSLKAVP
jgi:signal transduction histidine kinase